MIFFKSHIFFNLIIVVFTFLLLSNCKSQYCNNSSDESKKDSLRNVRFTLNEYSNLKSKFTFNESLEKWKSLKRKHHNSYTYIISSSSGYEEYYLSTEITVKKNKVVNRKLFRNYYPYPNTKINGKLIKSITIIEQFNENKYEIGSHKEGAPPVSLDDLYSQCICQNLSTDSLYQNCFTTFNNGIMQECYSYPKGIVVEDDGRSIDSVKFE